MNIQLLALVTLAGLVLPESMQSRPSQDWWRDNPHLHDESKSDRLTPSLKLHTAITVTVSPGKRDVLIYPVA